MKPGKIKAAIDALTPEQNRQISIEIDDLIRGEMSYIVGKYVRNYSFILGDTFGWSSDDILQQIRIRFWRGLATFDESKKVKKTTYLGDILSKYFSTLLKRCRSKKNKNTKMSPIGDSFSIFEMDENIVESFETMQTTEKNESYLLFISKLSDFEAEVFELFFIIGYQISVISEILNVKPRKISTTIKTLKELVRQHYQDLDDEMGELNNDLERKYDPSSEPGIDAE